MAQVPAILGADGRPMLRPRAGAQASAYSAADPVSQELATWWPWSGSADSDLLPERERITARIRDLVRNNGWASGAVSRYVDSVIGANLRFSSTPDHRALGIDPDAAAELGDCIETELRLHGSDPWRFCDAARHDSLGGLFSLAFRHYVVEGDALGVILWRRRGGRYATCLQIVDPDRLSNPDGRPDTDRLRAGVETDADGAAIAYHFRKRHPRDWGLAPAAAYTWERVPRETRWGRPAVLHHFDRDRAGQTRGVGRLAPVVKQLKMLDRYEGAELAVALLNTILAAYIESPFDHTLLADALDDPATMAQTVGPYQDRRAEFHEARQIMLGGARIPTLFPGEKIGTVNAAHPTAGFAAFESALLLNIAAPFTGLSYEQFTGDWSKSNYSSARGGIIEAAKTVIAERMTFAGRFCTPYVAAVVEEAINSGRIVPPPGAASFYEAPAGWLAGRWIGPGRGWVDPVKEAQAALVRMQCGLSTLELEAAEQGLDWQELIQQRARENAAWTAAGLPDPNTAAIMGAKGGDDQGAGGRQEEK